MTRSLITPLLLAVLALGAGACGGDDDPSSGPTSSSPDSETSTTEATESPEPPSDTPLDPGDGTGDDAPSESSESGEEEPGDDDGGEDADDAGVVASMQTSLQALVDPKTTPRQKAGRIVGGRDLAPLFRQFADGSGDADIAFTVQDPEVEGRRATALVGATDRGQPFAAPARTPFVLADGEWRLERRTVCVFAEQVGLHCP